MSPARLVPIGLSVVLALLLWPEFSRYRAEWSLGEANARLERVLRGMDKGPEAERAIQRARLLAEEAGQALPADARPALMLGVARIMLGDGAGAERVLRAGLAIGERPELSINLGRALGIQGQEAQARAAFLRTAWVNPHAIRTLPSALRVDILDEVSRLEARLQAGTLDAPPPLPATQRP